MEMKTKKIPLFMVIVWFVTCVRSQTVTKSISVKGQLFCGQSPAINDVGASLFLDKESTQSKDLVDNCCSRSVPIDSDSEHLGSFTLQAIVEEPVFTDEQFRVTIYHKCQNNANQDYRSFDVTIPNSYISDGVNPLNVFNIGKLNLQVVYPEEKRVRNPPDSTALAAARRVNQAIETKGELYCGDRPLDGATVRLFSKYSDATEMTNQIDHSTSGISGLFQLEGFIERRGDLEFEPTVKIYHKCDDNPKKTDYRVVTLKIPKTYITEGRYAFNNYDMGKLNMQAIYPKEKREKMAVTRNDVAKMLFNKI